MPCYRQGQNHISVFLHFVSKLTFPIAIHCKTNAGSTHILVALRRGWEKDCCCYVHLALLPTGWNKSTAKSKSDGQKRHDHVTQATMHSNSPCQKPLTNLDLQSTLEFPCPKPCPKMQVFIHPPMFSETVLFFRLMCLQQSLHATQIMKAKILYNKRMFAMGLKSDGC